MTRFDPAAFYRSQGGVAPQRQSSPPGQNQVPEEKNYDPAGNAPDWPNTLAPERFPAFPPRPPVDFGVNDGGLPFGAANHRLRQDQPFFVRSQITMDQVSTPPPVWSQLGERHAIYPVRWALNLLGSSPWYPARQRWSTHGPFAWTDPNSAPIVGRQIRTPRRQMLPKWRWLGVLSNPRITTPVPDTYGGT